MTLDARRRVRAAWLSVLKHTLNRVTSRAARRGVGPFSLVRHVGRRTGRTYETPVILARVEGGFVAELTYGPEVQWYRNIVHAGRCELVAVGTAHQVDRIEPYGAEEGLRAFGPPAAWVLRALRRHEFRFLHEKD